MPNKLSQFWQELKRRNVTRVLAVYIAAAFMILELISMFSEQIGLPNGTWKVAFFISLVGLVVAVIVSWIYDLHPEGGIVKTEPADKVKSEEIPKSSNGWKIASYISFVVIVGLIVLNIVPRKGNTEILDKSIAVLPFINDSEEIGNEHIINGIMEEILINLQSIKELRVPARTSVEQYRNNPKPVPEIASELNVAYIVEGSGQRYGKKIRLRVQLVEGATDKHIWADSYDEEINEPEDIFRIQSQIAESIAAELEAIITPEEKLLIEKIPTTNLTAYDFYQRGKEEYWKYTSDNDNIEALERAEELYHDALEYDSTFAEAYSELAKVYWNKHYWETYFSDDYLDSALILADIALYYDNQLAEAYAVRGHYYLDKGFREQAIREFDKAIKFNPNDGLAYQGRGWMYLHEDLVKSLANFQKAASLIHGSELPIILRDIGRVYQYAGFIEKGNNYIEDAFKLDDDSVRYYSDLAGGEWYRDNYAKAIEYVEKGYAIDSTDSEILNGLGFIYLYLGQFEESLKYFIKYIERLEELGTLEYEDLAEIGCVYFQNGYKEEADYYLDKQINYSNKSIELNRFGAQSLYTYYDLAAVYALRGEKDKAYENVRIFNQRRTMPKWAVVNMKKDPLFNSIRDEPEFQQIVRDVEAKYQAEHERVRQWLEENDML